MACGKSEEGNSDITQSPTLTPTTAPATSTEAPKDVTETPLPSATVAPAITGTEEDLPTATPEITESEQPTPTPLESTPTEIPPTPTPSLRDTTAERDEYWELTYLIWIPKFTDGFFTDKASDDTFDYAEFTEVNAADVSEYIDTLKSSGFENIKTNTAKGDYIEFAATNKDDWMVRLNYSEGVLKIGSGFIDEDSPSSEEELRLNTWNSTALQYLPEFKYGTFVSTTTDTDELTYTYAFFSDITEDEVREYVASLKAAGYVYGPDEGDSDGIIWYMAINDDRLNCYLAYDNNLVKIGCGYEE